MQLRIVASLMLLTSSLRADWIPLQPSAREHAPAAVTILEDNISGTVFRVDVAGIERSRIVDAQSSWDLLDLGSEATNNIPGFPDLPAVTRVFIVPDDALVTAEIVESDAPIMLQGFTPAPGRPSWEEGKPEPPYTADPVAYAAAGFYPSTPVSVSRAMVFRDFRIVRVAVYPLRYDAASKSLEATPSVTVRLRYTRGPGENPRTEPRHPIPPSFAPLYRAALTNYEQVLQRDYAGIESGRDVMLCIMPDSFVTTFTPYAKWRNATGTEVHIARFSEIGANATNPDLIKNYIAQTYVTWTYPPTHVLLVGDYGKVPRKIVDYDYDFANEDYFVELAGDDYFPEMMIGRFTHETNYRLGVMINKFMKYEQTPYRTDTTWFRKATVCSNNAYESQVSTKRFAAEVLMNDGHFLSVDTMMSKDPCTYSVPDIIAAVNNGRGILNYRGEGWSDGWHANCYGFHTSDVSTINNGQKFTFVTSIGCGVAMFDAGGGNCFGEEWVELGTNTSPRGAVAFVGPTSNTHTTYNNKIDRGIYVGLFQEGMDSPGQALLRGKLYMFTVYGTDPRVEYHYRVYCVLGDPSLHIWKQVPAPVTLTAPTQAAVGYNQIEVTVTDSVTHTPLAGATVIITGDVVFATATTDAAGRAIVGITPTAVDTLTVTVRGQAIVPRQQSVSVTVQQNHLAPEGAPLTTDTDGNLDGRMNPGEAGLLTLQLKNWGTLPASNVEATLSAIDTALIEVLSGTPAPFGTISPESVATGSPYAFRVKSTCPVGAVPALGLHVTAGASSWNYTVLVTVTGCILTCTGTLVNDQGSATANGRLDAGETAIVVASLSNIGEDAAPGVRAVLRSNDSLVTVVDSLGTFGLITVGGSAANTADFFVVAVDSAHPANSSASFTLLLETQGGRYPYGITRSLPIPIGTPAATDPTGPDAFGYYAYTSEDTVYDQAPAYAWSEIDGIGSIVPRDSDGDFTTTVTLPFTFRYYNRSYTQMRISSDGWLAFGSGTQASWQNYPLPNNDNVNNMVALFWDDLFSSGTSQTGRMLYYADAANHRFIVEWYNVDHYSDSTDRETFQAILLDPAYYPTASGNGDILLQYQTVTEDGGMTLGIEDSSETMGLTYVFDDVYDPSAQSLKDGFTVRITTERPTLPTTQVSVTVNLATGWNMLSNPVLRPEYLNAVRTLFPTSLLDYVYGFHPETGYSQSATVPNGFGFWAKFGGSGTTILYGDALTHDTIDVAAGWNMVGSVSSLVDTAGIITIPPGIRSSQYYGYGTGYSPSRYLVPGQAYWVKTSAPGQLVLEAPGRRPEPQPSVAAEPMTGRPTLTITDATGAGQTLFFTAPGATAANAHLYAMPPPPPEGVFDARFQNEDGGTLLGQGGGVVELRDAAFPLRIAWEGLADDAFTLVAGDVTRHIAGSGEITLNNPGIRQISLLGSAAEELPVEFALGQNYPNPFNPTTTIPFDLPMKSEVTIEIFNLLGQRVRTLVNGELPGGRHRMMWDGTGDGGRVLGSGVLFIRMNARGEGGTSTTMVRRMILLK